MARRGGLVVIPQDIPIEVVTEVVSWVKGRHHVLDTPIVLAPHQTVADALATAAQARAQRGRRRRRRTPAVGVVTDTDLSGVDRFTQLEEVMSKDLILIDADTDRARDAFNTPRRRQPRYAPAVDGDGRQADILTAGRPARHPCTRRPPTRGQAPHSRRRRHNGDVRARPGSC
ncbi:hypothetical protein GCM10023238_27110 [Streptomyces heliomycini]